MRADAELYEDICPDCNFDIDDCQCEEDDEDYLCPDCGLDNTMCVCEIGDDCDDDDEGDEDYEED
jgi:hypothetical protein